MERAYKRWFCGFGAAVVLLLAACAAVVYTVDPALYYRMPEDGKAVFFNERYQSAGMVKNVPAETVLIGTSMAANYRAAKIGEIFGGTALRITLPDGYFSEFDQVMETLYRHQSPKRVIFGLDMNVMIRDESNLSGVMPGYLYNRSVLDDAQYLLNKDNLYYSAYALLNQRKGTLQTLDEGFTWDQDRWWSHKSALIIYQRPPQAETKVPEDAYLERVRANLAVMDRWFRGHPDTEFRVFLSPYSLLSWDKMDRLGDMDAMLAALELTCHSLMEYDNVSLYGYLMDREFVEDLDNYEDHVHHSPQMGNRLLAKMAAEEGRLTKENVAQTIANWREFVVNYDYEKFWDEAYWAKWYQDKAAGQTS